ncbi:caspase, EACC1-associated type [Nocardia sp. NBC_01329]|uniref:caspase, EACC1-associated type n=1 Tax=Nocardia sp. NBC_01329 TaxID=2903594 RepID=UPI002E155227|nr:caspase family protein [Nocardia sp. NBC_01329]
MRKRNGWRAALVGVSRYSDPEFPDIPAAGNNVRDLARSLTGPGAAFDEEHCTVLSDPGQSAEVGKAVAAAARDAEDVLLVYYTGHGVVDRRGRLYLALPDTDHEEPEWSSVAFTTLRDELMESRARARILILDCCFSGRAFEAMSSPDAVIGGQIDIRGTYTITSSARDETSLAPEGHRYTAFTGALLSAAADTGLTLDQLYQRVDRMLHQNSQPRPQRRSVNIAGELRLFTAPDPQPATDAEVTTTPGTDADSESLFESAQRSADQGDTVGAEALWRRAAAQGHLGAMNNLANLLVARKQSIEAHDWYRKAAESGNPEAMGNLANLLYEEQFLEDAERWWRLAGEAGNTDAMYNLAVMLDRTLRFDDAIIWYQQAAESGHTDAMHNMAIRLRLRGHLDDAEAWWRRAGHKRAQRANVKPRGPVSRTQTR